MKVSESELIASVCRESFYDFCREFIGEVIQRKVRWNWHMKVLCDEMQAVAERVFAEQDKEHDLAINVPPGTTKSTIISVLFPAWVWTRMPHAQIIGASYAHTLALELSRKGRDVVKSDKYQACFPEIKIRDDQDAKGLYVNTKGGKRYAVGSRGDVIGQHADFILIDDPIDPSSALSEAEMFAVNFWIKNVLSGRKTEKASTVTILVMQRVHMNDPTAQMIAPGNRTRHIRIPVNTQFKINPPELADYYVNGLMDPARIPQAQIDELRGPNGIGEYGFAAQYGQDPVPIGGGKFKMSRIRWGRPPDKFKRLVRSWDKAATQQKNTLMHGVAFSVGTLMAFDFEGKCWVLDVIRRRMDSAEREDVILKTAKNDGRGVIVAVEQEGGSQGKESAEATAKRLKGYRVKIVPAGGAGSKDVRAEEFSVCVNAGNCWLPEKFRDPATGAWMGWAADWIEEGTHWPNSTYLDQFDSASTGYTVLARERVRVGAIPGTTGDPATRSEFPKYRSVRYVQVGG